MDPFLRLGPVRVLTGRGYVMLRRNIVHEEENTIDGFKQVAQR